MRIVWSRSGDSSSQARYSGPSSPHQPGQPSRRGVAVQRGDEVHQQLCHVSFVPLSCGPPHRARSRRRRQLAAYLSVATLTSGAVTRIGSDSASRQPTGPRAGHSPPGCEWHGFRPASFRPDHADTGRREEVAVATVSLPANPDLGHLRRQARALQRAAGAGDPAAAARIARHHPNPPAT